MTCNAVWLALKLQPCLVHMPSIMPSRSSRCCQASLFAEPLLFILGRSWDFTKAKLYTDFSGVQKNGWRLWPLASWITYQFVPLRLRVLFVNVVAFFWRVPSQQSCLRLACNSAFCCKIIFAVA